MPAARLLACALLLSPSAIAQSEVNLAPSGVASQSTEGFGGVASRAIDGSTNGVYNVGSVTHTQDAPGSWWRVDLPGALDLDRIVLHNRADCCGERLSNFRVSVWRQGVLQVAQDFHLAGTSVPQGGTETMLLPAGLFGDQVRVELLGPNLQGNDFLSLAEVEVFGPGSGAVNLAPAGAASQSTTASGGDAARGNDGVVDGQYNNGSVTHTEAANDLNAWWEVQLGGSYLLREVVLCNRGDCCWDRLSNFRVSVYAGATEVFGQDHFVGAGSVDQHARYPVTLPPATSGDRVRVQLLGTNNTGGTQLSLSEVEVWGAAIGSAYCPGVVNSIGASARLFATGSTEVAQGELTLSAVSLPTAQVGYMLASQAQGFIPNPGGSQGHLCLAPPIGRFASQLAATGAAGSIETIVDLNAVPTPLAPVVVLAGETWAFQCWYQDGGTSNFTDAVLIGFQ